MESFFSGLSPVTQALVASLFTWGVTALGASVVFFTNTVNRRLLDLSLGFAAGVMIAASFWSLLAPSIALAREMGMIPWLPAVVGFLAGGAMIRIADALLPHLHLFKPLREAEGTHTNWTRSVLMVVAITLHNIPEGLAIGVSFGAAGMGLTGASLGAAIALAIGIGLQNAPEGSAISLPLRGDGLSRVRAWWYGQMSAAVEPVAAVIGAAGVMMMRPILPYALAFAAGAMIYVVVEEVIPESHSGGNADAATLACMVGFVIMMTLDVALG
ncbi:MAG: ZIP family metal transporter [Acidobacteriota bacterium]|nr:ZIP family metal transporter [Acidobacteriota bacterium]MDQ3417270.1 ZIP family metal transporter [Acidobacteriota bacterium]